MPEIEPTETKLVDEALKTPQEARIPIRVPARHNPTLQKVIERVNADQELYALWEVMNVNAVERMGMSDHGPVHFQIVANISLKILRLLLDRGIVPNIVSNYGMTNQDAEVIVVLTALLHDLGMSIHRINHEEYSLFVSQPIIDRLLQDLYPVRACVIVRSEVLHAIISHRSDGHPLTLEAGIVRVGDALDMTKGRSRIPFEAGKVNIHSLSAAAIEQVEIAPGVEKPVHINVRMSNSAGVFQVDDLLKEKLHGSGLERYVEVEATIEGETEKKLVTIFRI